MRSTVTYNEYLVVTPPHCVKKWTLIFFWYCRCSRHTPLSLSSHALRPPYHRSRRAWLRMRATESVRYRSVMQYSTPGAYGAVFVRGDEVVYRAVCARRAHDLVNNPGTPASCTPTDVPTLDSSSTARQRARVDVPVPAGQVARGGRQDRHALPPRARRVVVHARRARVPRRERDDRQGDV